MCRSSPFGFNTLHRVADLALVQTILAAGKTQQVFDKAAGLLHIRSIALNLDRGATRDNPDFELRFQFTKFLVVLATELEKL